MTATLISMISLPAPRPTWREMLLVVGFFGLLSIAWTWPMPTNPARLSLVHLEAGDYRMLMWAIFWGRHALLNDPLNFHHANIFTPEPYSFAYSDMPLSQTLLALPVIQASYNPVLAYNYLLVVSMVIGGLGAYLLARHLTGHRAAALLGAMMWVLNPARFGRWAQIQLFADHWLPWFALSLLLWLEMSDSTRSPDNKRGRASRWRWGLAATAFYCLHALTGSHNAVFGALLGAAIVVYYAVRYRLWGSRRAWCELLAMALIALAVLAPIFYPYLILQERMLAQRRADVWQLDGLATGLYELVSSWSHFYLWLDRATGWPSVFFDRRLLTLLFPGLLPLLLAAFGFWRVGNDAAGGERKRWLARRLQATPDQLFWLMFLTLCFFLSLGPRFGLYLLLAHLPGVSLIRVPSRFLMPANLALAMLAAYGAASLARRLARRDDTARSWTILGGRARRGAISLGLIGVLYAAEATYAPMTTNDFSPDPPAVYRWIGEQQGDFAVLEYPIDPRDGVMAARRTFFSIYHWKSLIIGYSGWQSDENAARLGRLERTFPDEAALDELASLQVRYVLVFEGRIDAARLDRIRRNPRLVPVRRFDRVQVYGIR